MNLVSIEARDLPDAWFQSVYKVLEEGKVFTIDKGSYAGQKRLEFDYVTINVKYPGARPLLPQIPSHYGIPNPVDDDYLDKYLPYLMTSVKQEGESYTYGERLIMYMIPRDYLLTVLHDEKKNRESVYHTETDLWKNGEIIQRTDGGYPIHLNQIEYAIWRYKTSGYRNNQITLQVAHPSDMLIKDPPCLRHIDTRIQDGKLHFFVYFRSWDLWNGFPANLGAVQLLKEYMAENIGVEDGEMIASSKGLHLYDHCFDIAKVLRMKEDMTLKNGGE